MFARGVAYLTTTISALPGISWSDPRAPAGETASSFSRDSSHPSATSKDTGNAVSTDAARNDARNRPAAEQRAATQPDCFGVADVTGAVATEAVPTGRPTPTISNPAKVRNPRWLTDARRAARTCLAAAARRDARTPSRARRALAKRTVHPCRRPCVPEVKTQKLSSPGRRRCHQDIPCWPTAQQG